MCTLRDALGFLLVFVLLLASRFEQEREHEQDWVAGEACFVIPVSETVPHAAPGRTRGRRSVRLGARSSVWSSSAASLCAPYA